MWTNREVPTQLQNLPNDELTALKYSHFVIKPAYEGSSIIIMDKDNYSSEGYQQ